MRFKYTGQWIPDYGLIYTPRLPVVVTNPETSRDIPITGLVDSGSAAVIINPEIGEALGIDTSKGERVVFGGVGGRVVGTLSQVKIRIVGSQNEHEVTCAFADVGGLDMLLGQDGFFEHYKVLFEKYKNQFEVATKR